MTINLTSQGVKKLTLGCRQGPLRALLIMSLAGLGDPRDAAAQASPQLPAGFPEALDLYIERAVSDWEVPGLAIAIVRNDSVLVAKGYGVRELGKPERVDANTVFNVASLTKSFTALPQRQYWSTKGSSPGMPRRAATCQVWSSAIRI